MPADSDNSLVAVVLPQADLGVRLQAIGELVLIAGRDPLRHAGGAESYMVAHAHAATRAGLRPTMFVLGRSSDVLELDYCRLERVATPARPIVATAAVLHRPWLLRALVAYLRDRSGPHVIHAHSGWSDIAARACRELRATGVQASAVATFFTTAEHGELAKYRGAIGHGSARLRILHAWKLGWVRLVAVPSERRGYHAARCVTLNYESVRRLLEQAYGPRPGVVRLPYAAATAFAPERPRAESAHRNATDGPALIVAVSRHSARKGLDVLIRALSALRDDGVPFRACLVGTGTLLGAHRSLVRSLGLEAHVELPGSVPDVMPYLHDCDVYVLPSVEEGSGSVAVLEALQAGAAIVSTGVDGIPEDLTHEVDALLVAPGSVGELGDALRRAVQDGPLRARLGTAARALYDRRFAPEVVSEALADFYASLGL
jgi:glycosyltransferase involved in cell wall biosynthesis